MRYAMMGSNDIDASSGLHLSISMETDFDEDASMRSGSSPASQPMSLDQPAPAAEAMSVDDVAMMGEDGDEQADVDGGADVAMEDEHGLQAQDPQPSHFSLPVEMSGSLHREDHTIAQCPPGPRLKPVPDINVISRSFFPNAGTLDGHLLNDTIVKISLGSPIVGRKFYATAGTAQKASVSATVETAVQGLQAMRITESSSEEPRAKRQKHSSYESFSPFPYTPPTYTPSAPAETLPSHDRLQGLKAKVSSSNGDLRTRLSSLRQPELLKNHGASGFVPSSQASPSRLPPSRRVSGLAERMRVGGARKRPSDILTARGNGFQNWEQQNEERSFVARLFGKKRKVNAEESSSTIAWADESDRTMVASSEETVFESASSEDASDEWSSGDDDYDDPGSDIFASESRTQDNVREASRAPQEPTSSHHGLYTIPEETCAYDKTPGELKPHICRAKKPCRLSNGSLLPSTTGKWVFAGTTKPRRPSLLRAASSNSLQNRSGSGGLSTMTNLVTSAMGKLVLAPQRDARASSLGSTSKQARKFAVPSLMRKPAAGKAIEPSLSLITAPGTVSRGPGNTIQNLFPPGTDLNNMDYYVPPSSRVQRDVPRVVLSTAENETIEDEEEIRALGNVPSRFKESMKRGDVKVVGGTVVWGGVEVQRRKP